MPNPLKKLFSSNDGKAGKSSGKPPDFSKGSENSKTAASGSVASRDSPSQSNLQLKNAGIGLLKLASGIAEDIPIPGVHAVLQGIVAIIERSQVAVENQQGFKDLLDRTEKLKRILKKVDSHFLEEDLQKERHALEAAFDDLLRSAEAAASQGLLVRFLNSDDDSDNLARHVRKITETVSDFHFAIDLDTNHRVRQQAEGMLIVLHILRLSQLLSEQKKHNEAAKTAAVANSQPSTASPAAAAAAAAAASSTSNNPKPKPKRKVTVTLLNTSNSYISYRYEEDGEEKEDDVAPDDAIPVEFTMHKPYRFTLRSGRTEKSANRTWTAKADFDLGVFFR